MTSRKKRWRTPHAAPGELRAQYGRLDGDLAIIYVNGGEGAGSPDGRILCNALERVPVFDEKTLAEELEARGYDLTTLRFSIRQKNAPHR